MGAGLGCREIREQGLSTPPLGFREIREQGLSTPPTHTLWPVRVQAWGSWGRHLPAGVQGGERGRPGRKVGQRCWEPVVGRGR